jgi:rapamycin-insensitive companion of mTOR
MGSGTYSRYMQLWWLTLSQGNIGAAEGGLPFLEDEDVIPELIRVAEESPVLSVRG